MTDLRTLKPGDLVLVRGYSGGRTVSVKSVGRKWIYAGGSRFSLEGQGEYGQRLYVSKEAYESEHRRERAWSALKQAAQGHAPPAAISTETIEQAIALLTGGAE